MRLSGKVTHSFYCFLRIRGFDVSRLFEMTSLEMEFLKDPSQWMSLNQVESLLQKLNNEYSVHFVDQDFITTVGHSCFDLNAWGELDSVLKMKKAEPIFSHLDVFLSYFISDGFYLDREIIRPGFFGFKCNLSSEDYPFVTEYIRSILEVLPTYAGKVRAEAKWIRDYIQVKWEDESTQASLFPSPSELNIKPELLSDLRYFLEKIEKELYLKQKQILEKDKQIRNLQDQLLMQGMALPEDITTLFQKMEQELLEIKGLLLSEGQKKEVGKQISESLPSRLDSLLDLFMKLKEVLNI